MDSGTTACSDRSRGERPDGLRGACDNAYSMPDRTGEPSPERKDKELQQWDLSHQ